MKASFSHDWHTLLCLLLIICAAFSLCTCSGVLTQPGKPEVPGEPDDPFAPGEDDDDLPKPSEKEPLGVLGTGIANFPTSVTAAYQPVSFGSLEAGDCAVAEIGGYAGGAHLDTTAFPVVGRYEEEVEELTAAQLIDALRTDQLEAKVYRLTDASAAITISGVADRVYQGNGAIILSPVPLTVMNSARLTIKDLTWVNVGGGAAITAAHTSPLLLCGVEAVGKEGVVLGEGIKALTVCHSRILASGNGLVMAAAEKATIYDSAIAAEGAALVAEGRDVFLENCLINAPKGGLEIRADDSRIWYCTVRGGIKASGTTNLLLAQNVLYGTPWSVSLRGACNTVALLNLTMGIRAETCRSSYVVENVLGFNLESVDSDYILGNDNQFGENAGVRLVGTHHESGNNLTNANARAAVGANEALLPKVDRDLFVGMARQETVRERDHEAERSVVAYLEQESARTNKVILAPGAYSQEAMLRLTTALPHVTIYAYGVLMEKADYHSHTIYVNSTDHLTVKGLSIGHPFNSSGNTVAVSKRDGNTIELVAGAGMIRDWTDTGYYNFTGLSGGIYGYRAGHAEPYADMNFQTMAYDPATGIITLTVSPSVYALIEVGDTITCRGGNGAAAIQLTGADSPCFEDVTIYGSAGFAFNDASTRGEGLALLRAWVTTAATPVITEEIYQAYRALEERYGVSFALSQDAAGRYRGTPHKMSTVDATHSSNCQKGLTAISCQFESMCDDGTNQCSAHARMAGWEDMGDGRLKLYFKSTLSSIAMSLGQINSNTCCILFEEGDLIYMYTTKGRLICDKAPALSNTLTERTQANEFGGKETVYSVMVEKDKVALDALADIDLESSQPRATYVAVDNRSWSSDHFLFDNCLVRNMRSRCILLQASHGIVRHCSLLGSGMAAIQITHDESWGESGVAQDVQLLYNKMENNGHYNNVLRNSPIYIMGMGRQLEDAYLDQTGFSIIGNHFIDRNTTYALVLQGVSAAVVRDNHFGTYQGMPEDHNPSVFLDTVRDIEIEDNSYPSACTKSTDRIAGMYYDRVTGADAADFPVDEMVGANVSAFLTNLPTWRANGEAVYHGGWTVGCVDRLTGTKFIPYSTYESDNMWLCNKTANLWGGLKQGGLWLGNGYGFAAQDAYNVVIGYTAPKSGVYAVRVASFTPPGGDGNRDGLFALAVDGRVVWPAAGDYNEAGNYFRITGETTLLEMQNAFKEVEVYLEEGQMLQFTARKLEGWSRFSFLPLVIFKEQA